MSVRFCCPFTSYLLLIVHQILLLQKHVRTVYSYCKTCTWRIVVVLKLTTCLKSRVRWHDGLFSGNSAEVEYEAKHEVPQPVQGTAGRRNLCQRSVRCCITSSLVSLRTLREKPTAIPCTPLISVSLFLYNLLWLWRHLLTRLCVCTVHIDLTIWLLLSCGGKHWWFTWRPQWRRYGGLTFQNPTLWL